MSDSAPNMIKPDGDKNLRLAAPDPLPEDAPAPARGPGVKEMRSKVDDEARSTNRGPVVLALVIGLAAGAGLWHWRMTPPKPKTVAVETPIEYHKRQFLAALRGDTNNAGMQVRVDRMRFHQRVLISHGFLAERKFVFTNGATRARLAVNLIDGVSMEYAMVEPRGKDVLAVIAPRDDMPAWESVMRTAGGKKL
jgi:hypothetical protein